MVTLKKGMNALILIGYLQLLLVKFGKAAWANGFSITIPSFFKVELARDAS